jgi:hypothetical protein
MEGRTGAKKEELQTSRSRLNDGRSPSLALLKLENGPIFQALKALRSYAASSIIFL